MNDHLNDSIHTQPARPVSIRRNRLYRTALIVLTMLAGSLVIKPASALDRELVPLALRATVQMIVPDNDFELFSTGSGTIMTADGLILTNHHVVAGEASNGLMNDDALVGIAVTPSDLRGEAILKYFGIVVKTDPDLDLALVQIVGMADDPEVPLPANLGLAPIALGDSDELMISDEINIFGFPGNGRNTVTYTEGAVAGFLDEDRNGIYEWIKTNAEMGYGNSGGLATDSEGKFVGVPTRGNADDFSTIGLVRTGNIALDFVNSYFPTDPGSGPNISNVRYADAINRQGEPLNPAVNFASGITDLYAVFDHSGFETGTTLTYVWYLDGFESLRDSFPWDGESQGTSWVSVYNDEGLADGFVELELIYDDQPLYRGGVVIGEAVEPQNIDVGSRSFGSITFAEEVTDTDVINPGTSFSDLTIIYALFEYSGMANGVPWMSRWYYNGQSVLENEAVWDAGETGEYYVSLTHPDGLPPGNYTLELSIEGQVIQSSDFTILETSQPVVNEINLIGVVSDANNRRTRISGALIVFLQPGYTIDEWIDADFPDNMVHATGTSNANGEFQLDAKVTPSEFYGVVVVHDDYQPIAVDDYQIPADSIDPYELDVTMERK